jgi:hypothetical protein
VYPEGYNPWEYGEEIEKRRKHALSMLFAARKELAETGRVTEELKKGLQVIKETFEETDATRQITDFLETLPYVERMNEIRWELQNTHKGVINERFEKGDLQAGIYVTPQGYGSYEGDDPGATGSGEQRVTINAFKVIKVELEEDETKEVPKITIAVLIAVIVTLITQMLFTKCKKRHVSEGTTMTRVEEIKEEESEDDFV